MRAAASACRGSGRSTIHISIGKGVEGARFLPITLILKVFSKVSLVQMLQAVVAVLPHALLLILEVCDDSPVDQIRDLAGGALESQRCATEQGNTGAPSPREAEIADRRCREPVASVIVKAALDERVKHRDMQQGQKEE
jgi:hypothetical protein